MASAEQMRALAHITHMSDMPVWAHITHMSGSDIPGMGFGSRRGSVWECSYITRFSGGPPLGWGGGGVGLPLEGPKICRERKYTDHRMEGIGQHTHTLNEILWECPLLVHTGFFFPILGRCFVQPSQGGGWTPVTLTSALNFSHSRDTVNPHPK